ncbi:MAG: glycosyltransferase [Nitrospirae bacterium]|nr:glycosyltransferase [Nitrospirota bacterium]
MIKCRHCGHNLKPVAGVHIRADQLREIEECPACAFMSIYPFPDMGKRKKLYHTVQENYPSFDADFEWKLFFCRRYFHDNTKALHIGLESKMLASAFRKEKVDLVQIEAINHEALSHFKADEFDAIFVWDILEFVENFDAFFKQIKRILKPGGYISLRIRDAYSNFNQSRAKENLTTGHLNFMGREFIKNIYAKYFNDIPHCFMQEAYGDSMLTANGINNEGTLPYAEMNVLVVVHHYLFSKLDDATGPRGRVLNTIDMLKRKGVHADISLSNQPSGLGYDLVHLFHNAWETQDGLSQISSVKSNNAKVVISTIYMDPSETNFVINVINRIFKIHSKRERESLLEKLAQKRLTAGDLRQDMRFYARWNIEEDQKALLEIADRLICFSYTEMRQMSLNLDRTRPFSIVYNSANEETFGVHGPEIFTEQYGLKDFVIAAGHIEWRKNQLMLLYAMRDIPEIPIVIVGAKTDDEYYELCRAWSHKNTLFISQLKHRHLASAFAAARVHALPSWIEGISLSSIESSMCGCAPVVADRAGEIEYYGEYGFYANPGSLDSIRTAVISAYKRNHGDNRKKIKDYVRSKYTFNNAVDMTIDAYRKTISEDLS